jgi:hypothetical protein
MTEINTEVLEIRADISKEVAVDGFKAVGDYAMKQEASGDKEWEDGGTKKTIAHAAMGAIVAGIGDGDALDGAAGAGAREAASNLSAGKDDTTQQWISSAIGGVAGGATGASVALQGEKYNRQLHQKEIAFLKNKDNIDSFAKELYGENPTKEQLTQTEQILAIGGASLVDKSFNNALLETDKNTNDEQLKILLAQEFIKDNYKDSSAIFYNDKDKKFPTGTKGFDVDKDSKEYKDRYSNFGGYFNNKDFYQKNLSLNTNTKDSTGDYIDGVIKPYKNLANALQEDTTGTLKNMAEGIIDPIGTGLETGTNMRHLYEKSTLDSLVGDEQSAAQNLGEAFGGAVTVVVGGLGGKTFTKLNGKTDKDSENIANGHAWDKHKEDFPDVKTKNDLAKKVDKIIKNPSESKKISDGREKFWDEKTKTIVIKDPNHKDGGTVFKTSKRYYDKQ